MRKYFMSTLAALLILICSISVCCAAGSQYVINELDKMNITLPDTMTAATRNSSQADKYFSVFGLDYDTVMQNFEDGNIYLQGMNTESLLTLTVTMTKSSESEEIANYNLLSQEKLAEIEGNFLNQSEYTSCTPDEAADGKAVWLLFSTNVSTNGSDIKAYQAHTVYDGMSINITLQRNGSNVSPSDYTIFSGIVSSVSFGIENSNGYLFPVILIGGGVVLVVLIVILVIAIKRAGKKRRKKQNKKILSELASKYNLDDNVTSKKQSNAKEEKVNNGDYSDFIDINESEVAGNAESSDYVDEEIFQGSLEQQIKYKYFEGGDSVGSSTSGRIISDRITDEEIDEIINTAHSYEDDENKVVYSEEQDVSRSRFENIVSKNDDESFDIPSEEIVESKAEDEMESEDNEEFSEHKEDEDKLDLTEDGLTEQDEFNNDEELVRTEAMKTKFSDSDDFFEEAPKKSVGYLNHDELNKAEDFDVINEIENRAEKVRTEPDESEDVDAGVPIGERLKKIGEGLKYFGIHCGYFCTNVVRMIKRKRAVSKRKKAEQERRERARRNAERKRIQQRAAENGSLVRVHSRTDRRPPQGRTSQAGLPRTRRPSNSANNRRKPRR